MRGAHWALIAVLVGAASGLVAAAEWVGDLPKGADATAPSGWVYLGLIITAVGLVAVVGLGALAIDDTPTLQRAVMLVGFLEATAFVVLLIYMAKSFPTSCPTCPQGPP